MKGILVTTSLQETWPSSSEPIIFLGEWCLLHSKKNYWEKLNFRVLPYHWDNRKKFKEDFDYLKSLYELVLVQLSLKLNDIHEVNHPVHYWRIVLGPWLNYFIQVVYDRWAMLKVAFKARDISRIKIIKRKNGELTPNDTDEFIDFIINDNWNEMIYAKIFLFLEKPFKNIVIENISPSKIITALDSRSSYKKKLNKLINFCSNLTCTNREYFFISSYLSLKDEVLLNLKLKQVPKIWRKIEPKNYQYEASLRSWSFEISATNDKFLNILLSLIPQQIPKIYLEGYRNSVKTLKNSHWPSNPRGIFTSNSFVSDDMFKLWAAEKVQRKVPLFIGQHGGIYGIALRSCMQDHQLDIADYFFSWGWSKRGYEKKIIPLGNFKTSSKIVTPKINGTAMLVTMELPRYSYEMYSAPVSSKQFESYLYDQFDFVNHLTESIQKKIIVRLSPNNYDHSSKDRWNSQFPNIKLDLAGANILKTMKKCKIFISSYNATTYLESMAMNFPTLIFWNENFWELNDEASFNFDNLKSVGIFHETPKSAALMLIKIWPDVSKWWYSEEVQKARIKFCKNFSFVNNQLSDDLKNELLKRA